MTFHIAHEDGIYVSVIVPNADVELARDRLQEEGFRCSKERDIDGIKSMKSFDVMDEVPHKFIDVDKLREVMKDAGFEPK